MELHELQHLFRNQPDTPMKYILSLSALLAATSADAQNITRLFSDFSFRQYVQYVVEDHSKDLGLYPKPPFLTDIIITGMEKEITSGDSAEYYFSALAPDSIKRAIDYQTALSYFNRSDCFYTLLALSVHRNPDVRVYALAELKQLIRVTMVRNDQPLKTGLRKQQYHDAVVFLIYVLENTPWVIAGSENATIHRFYITNICLNLYLLTGEKPPFNDAKTHFQTEQEIQDALKRWKAFSEK